MFWSVNVIFISQLCICCNILPLSNNCISLLLSLWSSLNFNLTISSIYLEYDICISGQQFIIKANFGNPSIKTNPASPK